MRFLRPDRHAEPELVPPPELLRHRAALSRVPAAHTRAAHLAAIAADVRERAASPASRFASRTLRGAAAVVAALTITTGLAAADVLPAPAGRIISSVSDRITGHRDTPAAKPVEQPDADVTTSTDRTEGEEQVAESAGSVAVEDPARDVPEPTEPTSTTSSTEPSTTTTTAAPATTTIPGPTLPGSPTDPTDPGTGGGPTDPGTGGSPTDPGTGGGGGPTDGGTGGSGTDGSVGTTGVSTTTTVPTEDPVSPADGSG